MHSTILSATSFFFPFRSLSCACRKAIPLLTSSYLPSPLLPCLFLQLSVLAVCACRTLHTAQSPDSTKWVTQVWIAGGQPLTTPPSSHNSSPKLSKVSSSSSLSAMSGDSVGDDDVESKILSTRSDLHCFTFVLTRFDLALLCTYQCFNGVYCSNIVSVQLVQFLIWV